jgi:type I restriction enzyme, S subunit
MEVKPGYKETEIGIIPEDWDIRSVGEISDVKTGPFGSALHEKDYVREGTPIITVEHLGEYGVQYTNLPLVSDADKERLRAYLLRKGDIVFSRVGSVDRNALIKESEDGWLFSGRLLRVRPIREQVLPTYLSYHFHSEAFKQRVRDVTVGQTMASINTKILMGVIAVVPPTLAEQEAIAEALSDVDTLIEALEQLLAKKRQVKQGAMQELLTGKRRLPGFSGEWYVKKLGDIAPLQRGFDLPTSQLKKGDYPVVYSNGVLDFHSTYQAKAPGVVTGRSGTLGKVNFIETDYWPHNTTLWVTDFKGNYPQFIYYMYTHIKLERFGTGSGVPTLNRNDVHEYKTQIPPTLAEQTAIAEILSDMDAEIAALEGKLAKARQVKQGMMQELLTGRIRLV